MTVENGSFVIERTYDVPPARVFAAFSQLEAKHRWASCHEGAEHEMDFRVGGRERYRGGPRGGPVYTNETLYHDIVPDRRIVYTYEMQADGVRISVSLVTLVFEPAGGGTRMTFTEQAVFLDGHDTLAHREHGTRLGLDSLGEALRQPRS